MRRDWQKRSAFPAAGAATSPTSTPGDCERYLSENPQFARSALSRYSPADFIALVRRHGIAFHEKHKGQLFCDDSAEQIIEMLKAECGAGGVQWRMPCGVQTIRRSVSGFELETDAGLLQATRVVIATGGLSIPKIGATDFGYRVARQFGLRIVEPRPALVPLTFDAETWTAVFGACRRIARGARWLQRRHLRR